MKLLPPLLALATCDLVTTPAFADPAAALPHAPADVAASMLVSEAASPPAAPAVPPLWATPPLPFPHSSTPVLLSPGRWDAEARAQAADRAETRGAGIALTVVGASLASLGGVLVGAAVGLPHASSFGGTSPKYSVGMLGIVTAGVGVVVAGVGIPIWVTNTAEDPRRPIIQAELGIGPGSIELRGSF